LRVLPGTHREGRIPETAMAGRVRDIPERTCLLEIGGVLLMRPLLLHASSPATSPAHRRVLHVEYGPARCEQGFRLARE
jgi:ectoine hydroxylase-related dioxygenase (phytanoyl-CoA dioxygenase family)